MRDTEIAFLGALVHLAYGPSQHERTVTVRQRYRDITLWTGLVAIFRLEGHPAVRYCYAWIGDMATTSPVMLLESPQIDSAAAAVREHVSRRYAQLAA